MTFDARISKHALRILVVLASAVVGLCPKPGSGQNLSVSSETTAAWADPFFERAVAEGRTTGAVVVAVRDGKVVFAKGYGNANIEAGSKVDPDKTTFRIASISKTFLGTAVALLLEDGRIASLDDPANTYLKRIRLPELKGVPVRVRDLLTHSAGFEEKFFGYITLARTDPGPATQADLARFSPRQIRAPGEMSVYSNFGTGVLGVLIEDVTGERLGAIYDRFFFRPLGMATARVETSLSPDGNDAIAYALLPDGTPWRLPMRAFSPVILPAGGIVASGADMARFMLAQLGTPAGDGNGLPANVLGRLGQDLFTNHPDLIGMGMLFYQGRWNGERFLEHTGNITGYRSYMTLFPDSRTGIFVAHTGDAPVQAGPLQQVLPWLADPRLHSTAGQAPKPQLRLSEVRAAYMTAYLGPHTVQRSAVPEPIAPQALAGVYRMERRNVTSAEALLEVLRPGSTIIRVAATDGGGILINGLGPYREIRPGLFEADAGPGIQEGWNDVYAFAGDEDGRRLIPLVNADGPFVRIPGWADPTLPTGLLPLVALALTGYLAAFWSGTSGGARVARWSAVTLATLFVVKLLYLTHSLAWPSRFTVALFSGDITPFVVLTVLANCWLAATVLLIFGLFWRRGEDGRVTLRRRLEGLHACLLVVGALAALPLLAQANLIGWSLP